ncbi:MAG TPA: PD-(D/E)XK nuclease family protein [Thermoanaerobaculaceae bacterium]|nr:PD-(D/E)XK nuclease family protein [Thermoanaerobaculaceae bacterium]
MSEGSRTAGAGGRVKVARGARAVEALLLADIEALLATAEADHRLLAQPVVVVVPSRSLRLHVSAAVVAARGRSAAGIEVLTLHGLASEVAARCGERRRPGRQLLAVLVGRFARREPALARLASGFEDGELPVAATVRDLLDAGLTPEGAEAAGELLAGHPDAAERTRAEALVRIASGVAFALDAGGLDLPGDLLRRAARRIADEPDRALPARAVLVHGFADATGVATDLVEALVRHRGAWVYLDEPPDPAESSRPDLGVAFGRRFAERLQGAASVERDAAFQAAPRRLALVGAPGGEAEVREVARRVRALLDAGTAAQQIGVVARDLAPYARPIHRHFGRLAIPFAMLDGPGSSDAGTRRARALVELLRHGAAAPADSWLAAAGEGSEFDLRLALHACGAARLRDVAALDPAAVLDGNGGLPLPVRTGLSVLTGDGDGPDEEETAVAPHRRLPGARLRRAVARAAALVARLDDWPEEATLAVHVRRLRRMLAGDLAFRDEAPGTAAVAGVVAAVAAELPDGFWLARDEFLLVVRRGLAAVGGAPLGGAGGGVQVLSVTAARARTFGHLFVVGLNRDAFPRQVREDPLLPDRLRLALAALLPDIPIKRGGLDEERFLFAELVSAAEEVTLSWQACDDDGRVRPASPLLERLRLVAHLAEPVLAPPAVAVTPVGDLRPAHEHAVLAGMHASRAAFAAAFAVACREAGGLASAAGRLAVLDELDPERGTPAGRARARELGPYFGFVGAPLAAADPRRRELALTTAEQVAACPWQAFLQRLLHLEPSPDALAPPPGMDRATVGTAVHRVLERIVREAAPGPPATLAEALAASPVAVVWPGTEALRAIVRDVCARLARETGLALPGLDRVLARQAAPLLESARRLAWPAIGAALVTGAEVAGSLALRTDNGERVLAFRVDRVDAADGGIVLTDFKTGKPFSTAKKEATRRRHLLRAVSRGEALQAAAYALAAGPGAEGRYLFLRPDLDAEAAAAVVRKDDGEFVTAFEAAAGAVVSVWDRGALFPRLEEPDEGNEPRRCSSCEVRDACLRGDSGSRRRLALWAAVNADADDLSEAEAALLGVWRLHAKASGGRAAGEDEG